MTDFMTIEEAVNSVEWKDYGSDFDIDGDELVMSIWTRDSNEDEETVEEPDDLSGALVGLQGRKKIIPGMDGRQQIREMIHEFICHEADEKLWFNGERPFFPDHPNFV